MHTNFLINLFFYYFFSLLFDSRTTGVTCCYGAPAEQGSGGAPCGTNFIGALSYSS